MTVVRRSSYGSQVWAVTENNNRNVFFAVSNMDYTRDEKRSENIKKKGIIR